MHRIAFSIMLACGAILLGSGLASAETMHPRLAARLAGMGEHGVVNFRADTSKSQLCWTFELHTMGVTSASVRDSHGMRVAPLGMHYRAKGCAKVAEAALEQIEAKPRAYWVWVDTKGHPGELRGRLLVGMAHM
jgi:hypothetical protein